jgi:hypothetical protein
MTAHPTPTPPAAAPAGPGHGFHYEPEPPKTYGMMAEFLTPEAVLHAAEAARAAGYRRMDAYSPLPVDGLAEAVGFTHNRLPLVIFIGGLIGGLGGYFMQWYTSVYDYPIIVAGRPYNSWPSFVVITFELTILGASTAAVLGMLGLNGLPRPHHPVFNVPGFALASRSRFFLCIQAIDPLFDRERTRQFLAEQAPKEVSEVLW